MTIPELKLELEYEIDPFRRKMLVRLIYEKTGEDATTDIGDWDDEYWDNMDWEE